MGRGLLIGGALLLLLLGGALVVLFQQLDVVLERGIETYGPEMTQSDVNVDDVELSPADGEGEIKGFSVDNPKGYSTPQAMSVASIALGVDTGTIGDDVIVIRKVHVTDPQVTVEIAEDGSTNLEHLQRNVMEYVDRVSKAVEEQTGGSGGDGGGEAAEAGPEQKFILEDFRLTGGEITVHSKFLNLGEISSDLPDILMSDIGKQEGGMTGGELAAVLMTKIQKDAMKSVQRLDLKDVNNLMKGGLDALKGGQMEGAGEEMNKAIDDIGKAFGDMF